MTPKDEAVAAIALLAGLVERAKKIMMGPPYWLQAHDLEDTDWARVSIDGAAATLTVRRDGYGGGGWDDDHEFPADLLFCSEPALELWQANRQAELDRQAAERDAAEDREIEARGRRRLAELQAKYGDAR